MQQRWLPELPANLVLGCSSFSWPDWEGAFYPPGLRPADRIGWYSRSFDAVEVDATFYRLPTARMVSNWALKTPETFTLALKVPQTVTHELALVGTEGILAEFLETTALLGPRRGPLLLQFPYVAKAADPEEYETGRRFLTNLQAWLETWAGVAPWVVEVRNAAWLRPALLELLRAHQVPLALTAYYTMPSLAALQRRGDDVLTGPFAYVRFLGDRHRIDRDIAAAIAAGERQKPFESLLWDRERELREWAEALLPVVSRMRTWSFYNNHYAGFGPGSARQFARLWREIHDLD
ncbi:MAG: DUF72 domain-containing protein [Fimbriimonadaceae bacterium]|nr:DUF72 domain-containing protein [Fimbriimonadaceae bacterium]